MGDIAQYLPSLMALGKYGYILLFIVTFLEALVITGLFTPGTVVLVFMAGLVPSGYYEMTPLVAAGIAGAILGNAASYELGTLGKVHVERWDIFKRHMERSKMFFLRHTKKSIYLGRFFGPVRPFIPFIAGVFDMERKHFYIANVLSALPWAAWYYTLGYVFGIAWQRALLWSSSILFSILFVSGVTYVVFSVVRHFLLKRISKRTSSPIHEISSMR